MNRPHADRLDLAARGVVAGGLVALLAWGTALGFAAFAARSGEEGEATRSLGLTSLSIVPAGHRVRFVERRGNSEIDLRAAPTLPATDPDPAGWLIHDEVIPANAEGAR